MPIPSFHADYYGYAPSQHRLRVRLGTGLVRGWYAACPCRFADREGNSLRWLSWLAVVAAVLWFGCIGGVQAQSSVCDSVCLYHPGDFGSANWRIPALLCLDDGSLLAVCDRRKHNEGDLPEDIDIVFRRSADKGYTWSAPMPVVEGRGRGQGYGDAALIQCGNGDVLCLFVGGNGLWESSEAHPIRSYVCRSTDRGRSWSAPVELTAQLWGSAASNPMCRHYRASFFASGNALRLQVGPHAGRVLVAVAMCRQTEQVLDNYVVYSDDNGYTWQVSDKAFVGGDEAKLAELSDGRILISVRRHGQRGYNLSSDGGTTWGHQAFWPEMEVNACNGDLLRLDDTVLMHSLPNSLQREDVSIFLSRDEGLHWGAVVPVCQGPSVYSSLTRLDDGTIGLLVERNHHGACELWYYRMSCEWIVSHAKPIGTFHFFRTE